MKKVDPLKINEKLKLNDNGDDDYKPVKYYKKIKSLEIGENEKIVDLKDLKKDFKEIKNNSFLMIEYMQNLVMNSCPQGLNCLDADEINARSKLVDSITKQIKTIVDSYHVISKIENKESTGKPPQQPEIPIPNQTQNNIIIGNTSELIEKGIIHSMIDKEKPNEQ